jgi:hypothetical protein
MVEGENVIMAAMTDAVFFGAFNETFSLIVNS